jgi:hypothetical protein
LALFLMIAGAATVSVRADEPRPEDAVLVGEASENPERAVDEASREEVATTEADATIAEVEKVSTEADEAFIDAVESLVYANETKSDKAGREPSRGLRRGRSGRWGWRGRGPRGPRDEDGPQTGNRTLDVIFEFVDKDDDGVISKDEFKEAAERRFARYRWMRESGRGGRGPSWFGQHRRRGGSGQWGWRGRWGPSRAGAEFAGRGQRGRERHERHGHRGGDAERLSQLERQIEKLTEAVKKLSDDRD